MIVKPAQAEGFLAAPPPGPVLLHGADAGGVAAAAARIVAADRAAGGVRIYDAAEADPESIVSAAATAPLFGGRPLIRVRDAGDRFAKAALEILALGPGAARVIVEAGALTAKSSLRKAFEEARGAHAIVFYEPNDRDLRALVRRAAVDAGKRLDPGAEDVLATRLPRDTLAARAEIDKLMVYLGEQRVCTAADAAAAIGDSADEELSGPALAAADGDVAGTARAVRRLLGAATEPIAVLRAAQGHFDRLWEARAAVDAGGGMESALAGLRPPVFFAVRPRFEAQVRAWSTARLEQAAARLVEAEAGCKRTGAPADALAAHAFFAIAHTQATAKAAASKGR